MDQGLAAVIAAMAAGVFGITGVFAGIVVGRRQTTDQAAVEHQQWLRGQRQEAYLQLLEAFDVALPQLESLVQRWDDIALRADQQNLANEFEEIIHDSATEAMAILVKPIERVQFLGPEAVDLASQELVMWMDHMVAQFREQARSGVGPNWDWSTFWALAARGKMLRREVAQAAKVEMRTPPAPGR